MTLALLKSIFLLLLLILVTFSAPFPNDLCVETLHASWTFTRVSCLLVNGSVAVWPWNDSVWVFLQQIWIFLLVHTRMTGFAICALRVEVRCSTKAKGQTFPFTEHFIVHFLVIFCTDIAQDINHLFLFFFYLDLYSRKVYLH